MIKEINNKDEAVNLINKSLSHLIHYYHSKDLNGEWTIITMQRCTDEVSHILIKCSSEILKECIYSLLFQCAEYNSILEKQLYQDGYLIIKHQVLTVVIYGINKLISDREKSVNDILQFK